MESRHVYTVSEINREARALLENEFGTFWIQGEVSEITRAASGHVYFTLKDESAEISGVKFKSRTSFLSPPDVEIGSEVLAQGRLSIYEPRGRYQFIATLLQPVGAGALQRAFEKLKQQLQEEGLFDPVHKRPLPTAPETIGIVTSPRGAAIRDVVSVLERRWPCTRVLLFPSAVQGDAALHELPAALDRAERFSRDVHPLDLVILTRGGGSAEDLAAFNGEALARRIHACQVPVISAVGHEIDFSIADFAADHRAPTPSAAAEVAVPDVADVARALHAFIQRVVDRVGFAWRQLADQYVYRVDACRARSPVRRFETHMQRFDLVTTSIQQSIGLHWKAQEERAKHLAEVLRLSDPWLPLARGYSLTSRAGETQPLRDLGALAKGDEIDTRLASGRIRSRIEEVTPDDD